MIVTKKSRDSNIIEVNVKNKVDARNITNGRNILNVKTTIEQIKLHLKGESVKG